MEMLFIILYLLGSYAVAKLGEHRQIGYGKALFMAIIFSPPLGLIITLCSPIRRVIQ